MPALVTVKSYKVAGFGLYTIEEERKYYDRISSSSRSAAAAGAYNTEDT